MEKKVTPYKESSLGKKEQVKQMFDTISGDYDGLNRIISLGTDIKWRKRIVSYLMEKSPRNILDIATGTGDLAIALVGTGAEKIVGLDLSPGMLEVGKAKVAKKGLEHTIEMVLGDSEDLPFGEDSFDAVTVAFGVRNFEELERGISEMQRVLKPTGRLFVLEFSKPQHAPMKQLFRFYFHRVMPFFGKLVSKDKAAYTYLPKSVDAFPEGQEFLRIMERAGLHGTSAEALTGGIATLYVGRK